MRWLDWAVDDPAPADQCGYGGLHVPCELTDLSVRRGLVVHSVEGWFTFANPSAVMWAGGNSWGVTIMRSGAVWRHRLRPTFVNWHAGGPAQNIGTDGIEMEGKDQPWTTEQRVSLVRVLNETRDWFNWPVYVLGARAGSRSQEDILQALLALGYGSLWEHNWFDFTSCPSGRDDWDWLMPALGQGDDMSQAEVNALLAWQRAHADLLRAEDKPGTPAFLIQGGTRRFIPGDVWPYMGRDALEIVSVPNDYIVQRAPNRGDDLTVAIAQMMEAGRYEAVLHENRVEHVSSAHATNLAKDVVKVHEKKPHAGSGGVSPAEALAIAKAEDDKLRLSKE